MPRVFIWRAGDGLLLPLLRQAKDQAKLHISKGVRPLISEMKKKYLIDIEGIRFKRSH